MEKLLRIVKMQIPQKPWKESSLTKSTFSVVNKLMVILNFLPKFDEGFYCLQWEKSTIDISLYKTLITNKPLL